VTTARRADGALHDFRDLAGVDTLVVMMVVKSLGAVADQLVAAGRSADCPAAVVEAASTPRQRVVRGVLGTITRRSRAAHVEGPALLVVGEVVTALTGAAVEGLGVAALDEIQAIAL
jgi:siroheme synthase